MAKKRLIEKIQEIFDVISDKFTEITENICDCTPQIIKCEDKEKLNLKDGINSIFIQTECTFSHEVCNKEGVILEYLDNGWTVLEENTCSILFEKEGETVLIVPTISNKAVLEQENEIQCCGEISDIEITLDIEEKENIELQKTRLDYIASGDERWKSVFSNTNTLLIEDLSRDTEYRVKASIKSNGCWVESQEKVFNIVCDDPQEALKPEIFNFSVEGDVNCCNEIIPEPTPDPEITSFSVQGDTNCCN